MSKKYRSAGLCALGGALFSIASIGSAMAQESTAQSVGLEEVVVTARKKEERLLDVPLSIAAFSEEQIESAGLRSVADIAQQAPGFSFRQGFGRTGSGEGGAGSRPSIRGMSNILGSANASFFIDGIYVSGNITSYQLDNLERVEVIRGPQSALFGRQTFPARSISSRASRTTKRAAVFRRPLANGITARYRHTPAVRWSRIAGMAS